MGKLLLSVVCFWGAISVAIGQDNLLGQLEKESKPVDEKILGTFKGSRLINGHSVELRERGNLDFIISHRFGRINSGAYSFFGLDESNIRLGLDYSLNDRLTVGLGRNSFQKTYDGFFKYRLLSQRSGQAAMPISMVWFSNVAINTLKRPELPLNFKRKLAYTHQIMIARKFNEDLSLQLSPTLVHRNLVPNRRDESNLISLGIAGRYKLTPGTSLNVEYFYRMGKHMRNYNALAVGFDIETGGHVFQLHLTNAQAMTETAFIPGTSGDFFSGDIHFGFNISRSFQLKERPVY